MTTLSNHAGQRAAALPAWALGPFTRPELARPVIAPNPNSTFDCPMRGRAIRWEALHAFNPAAIVRDGRIHVIYRAEDDTGSMRIGQHTSRLGHAVSDDGIYFRHHPQPVLFPGNDAQKANEWDGGCEDPRLIEAEDGTYVLTYTQWNRKTPRLAIATSADLIHWTKHGPAFHSSQHGGGDWPGCKSGSIVCAMAGDRLKAVRIGGRFWMYWGEHTVRLASSTDLIHWDVVENAQGEPLVVLAPRPGLFDSTLVEAGPPALLTSRGILLIYNAKNDGNHGVPGLRADAYAAGQAIFDLSDPKKLLRQLDTPFLRPELPFESAGQYGCGTTFTEGLVYFEQRWWIYYGCADSMVGVAVYPST